MSAWFSFAFGQPAWLLLLPALVWGFRRRRRKRSPATILHSSTALLVSLGRPRSGNPGSKLRAIRFFAMALFIVAMARPHLPQGARPDPNKGIDIMLICDCSRSMDARDFAVGSQSISRREALLKAISDFVDGRVNDRIGMIGFAGHTYLLSPLTTDGNWIKEVYRLVTLKNGTAIGDGIVAGVDKLQENAGRSKVEILVTDGGNNMGCNPYDAADYARKKGVRIYTIQVKGLQDIKAADFVKAPLNLVATKTRGQFFQASDTTALMQIYRQIDRMEKHEFENRRYMIYDELFLWFVVPGSLLLLFEWIAGNTFWMRVP